MNNPVSRFRSIALGWGSVKSLQAAIVASLSLVAMPSQGSAQQAGERPRHVQMSWNLVGLSEAVSDRALARNQFVTLGSIAPARTFRLSTSIVWREQLLVPRGTVFAWADAPWGLACEVLWRRTEEAFFCIQAGPDGNFHSFATVFAAQRTLAMTIRPFLMGTVPIYRWHEFREPIPASAIIDSQAPVPVALTLANRRGVLTLCAERSDEPRGRWGDLNRLCVDEYDIARPPAPFGALWNATIAIGARSRRDLTVTFSPPAIGTRIL